MWIVALNQPVCSLNACIPPSPFLGGPGSGKGTHCARVESDFHFAHLSTGDLLREEVDKGSPMGREMEETMRQGKLVPSVSCLDEMLHATHYDIKQVLWCAVQ